MTSTADIADLLITGINGQSWSQSFTAARREFVEIDLETQGSALAVYVVPIGVQTKRVSMTTVEHTYSLGLSVIQRCDQTTLHASARVLKELNSSLMAYLFTSEPGGGSCIAIDNDPECDEDALRDFGLFVSQALLTFELEEDAA